MTETTTSQIRRRFVATLLALLLITVGGVLSIRRDGVTPRSAAATLPTTSTTMMSRHHQPHHVQLAAGVFATPGAPEPRGACPMSLRTLPPLRPHHRVHARHCTVLSMGDSLGIELGWGLQAEFANAPWINLVQVGKVSTGLSNSWYYNWPVELDKFLALYHPNVVVAFLGANDVRNLYYKNQLAVFGSPEWHKAYGAFVLQLVDETRRAHATLVWVGLPVMQATPYGDGIRAINNTVAAALRGQPNTAFITTEPVLASPSGAFLDTGVVNGVSQSLRSGDGIHMSVTGENVVSTFVDEQLAQLLNVGLTPAAPAVLQP